MLVNPKKYPNERFARLHDPELWEAASAA